MTSASCDAKYTSSSSVTLMAVDDNKIAAARTSFTYLASHYPLLSKISFLLLRNFVDFFEHGDELDRCIKAQNF